MSFVMSINFLPLFRDNSVAKSTQNGKLINTSSENFAESPGLQHWAEIENLKIAASTYANAKSISALEQQVAERRTISTTARSALVTLEHEMKPFAELIKYAEQFEANKPYHVRSKKSKNPDEYFRRHESKLLLYDGAKNVLQKAGIDTKNISLDQMRADYHAMEKKKAELQKSYRTAEKEISEMEQKLQTLNQYLNKQPFQKQPEEEKKQPLDILFMNQLILAPASLLAQRIDSIIDLVVPHDIHLPSGGTFVYHYCRQAAIFWKFLIKGV